jgi:signal transduction histidine kinase
MWSGVEIAAYTSLVLAYALLLLWTVRHRIGHGRAQRLLEATLFLAVLWILALGLPALLAQGVWWAFVWHRVAQIGLVVLAFLTADFAEAFVEWASRRWLRLAAVCALSLVAIGLDVWPFPQSVDVSQVLLLEVGSTELSSLLLMAAWALSTGIAWWIGIGAMRRATGSKHRNRVRYLLASLLSFTVGDLLIFIGGIPEFYAGLALRLLGFAIITFTISRFDLPDLRQLSLVSVRFLVMASLTAVLYLVLLLVAGLVMGGPGELSRLTIVAPAVVLAVLIAAGVDVALGPRLNRFFERTVLGQGYDVQKALRTYGQQVSLILDLERLADSALDWLRTTLRVERSAFILFSTIRNGQTELRILRSMGFPSPPAQLFSEDSRFIIHFRNIGRPLSQYDLDMLSWFRSMRSGERQWLQRLTADLYVPVLVAGRPVALLALGPKADGQPYSEEDIETLTILASQTGTAVENARLVDDLRAVQADLHRLNSELAETNRQLQRLDQVKADFVTIASHELRTPLSQIFGYSDVLASLEGDELSDSQSVEQFIGGIARGANRLKRVVDAMVDMSLIETGSLKMQLTMVPVNEMVEGAIHTIRSAALEREITITVGDLSSLPHIRADSARLRQVFISLLSNAVKFTPNGGAIVISGGLCSDEACVEVILADDGIGIEPDQQQLIFEKFYRPENPLLHSTDDTGFKGAGPGLGLPIAKGIVEAHGGRVWVESPGRDEERCPGSTFFVRLPVDGPVKE